jgi:sugar phosphate permease
MKGKKMSIGLLFWVIMVISLLFGLWSNWPAGAKPIGSFLIVWILFALLGWQVFGPALHK